LIFFSHSRPPSGEISQKMRALCGWRGVQNFAEARAGANEVGQKAGPQSFGDASGWFCRAKARSERGPLLTRGLLLCPLKLRQQSWIP